MIDYCPDVLYRSIPGTPAIPADNLIGRHIRLEGKALERNRSDPAFLWQASIWEMRIV